MSVNFHALEVNAKLLAALRRDASLTDSLCHPGLRHDPERYARDFFGARPKEEWEAQRPSLELRLKRLVDAQNEALGPLLAAGLDRDDVLHSLDLERSWWGMEAMIASPIGARIVTDDGGEAIGDDVGYGPARLYSPDDAAAIADALDRVTRAEAEPRFRAHEAADHERLLAQGLRAPLPNTNDEFERWSWRPFCTLRELVRNAAQERSWLLRWYD
jgi:hypothetical protein